MQALGGSTHTCSRPVSRSAPCARPAVQQAVRSVQKHGRRGIPCAAKLDDAPLFQSSTSSLLGGSTADILKQQSSQAAGNLDSVPLESDAGMDYSALKTHLASGDVRKADDETRALLIKLAGPAAVKRNWVYFSEVQFIPVKDLQTMDALWRAASGGKFGYSVQKEMWIQNQRRWPKFFKAIDWVQGENAVYRKWPAEFNYSYEATKGHMPLTNALRGTQLFEAIFQHPAFDKSAAAGGSGKKSIDELSREAGANTLKW